MGRLGAAPGEGWELLQGLAAGLCVRGGRKGQVAELGASCALLWDPELRRTWFWMDFRFGWWQHQGALLGRLGLGLGISCGARWRRCPGLRLSYL